MKLTTYQIQALASEIYDELKVKYHKDRQQKESTLLPEIIKTVDKYLAGSMKAIPDDVLKRLGYPDSISKAKEQMIKCLLDKKIPKSTFDIQKSILERDIIIAAMNSETTDKIRKAIMAKYK